MSTQVGKELAQVKRKPIQVGEGGIHISIWEGGIHISIWAYGPHLMATKELERLVGFR